MCGVFSSICASNNLQQFSLTSCWKVLCGCFYEHSHGKFCTSASSLPSPSLPLALLLPLTPDFSCLPLFSLLFMSLMHRVINAASVCASLVWCKPPSCVLSTTPLQHSQSMQPVPMGKCLMSVFKLHSAISVHLLCSELLQSTDSQGHCGSMLYMVQVPAFSWC